MKNINSNVFAQLMAENKPVLVDFWAPWCVYCRRIAPVLDQLGDEYASRAEIVKINIDEEPALAAKAGIEVLPTLVLYQQGRELDRVVAPASKNAIARFLESHLG